MLKQIGDLSMKLLKDGMPCILLLSNGALLLFGVN